MTAEHPWKKRWREAVTPEQRSALRQEIRMAGALKAQERHDALVAHRELIESRRCVDCDQPLFSTRRQVCGACKLAARARQGSAR